MATEKILIFDEAGNAKRMKVRIARFLDNEPVTSSDKENIRETLGVDDSLSGTFTNALSVTSTNNSSFTGDGKVGIGTSSPDQLIHASSSTGASLRLERDSATITSGQSYGAIEWEGQDASGGGAASGVRAKIETEATGSSGDAALKFYTAAANDVATERATIDSSGNVNVSSGQMQVISGAASAPSYAFDGDTDTGLSRPTTNAVNIVTGGTERLRVGSSGQLSVGASGGAISAADDDAALVLQRSVGGIAELSRATNTDGHVVGKINFANRNNSNTVNPGSANYPAVAGIEAQLETTDSNADDDSGGHLVFKTKPEAGLLATRVTIDSSGKVGIGGSPSYTLDVKRTDAAGDYLYVGASSDGGQRGLKFTSADNGAYLGAAHTIDATSGSGSIAFATGGTTRWSIDSSGSLIGSSNGTGASAASQPIVFYGTNSGSAQIDQGSIGTEAGTANSNAGELVFKASNSSGALTERFRINESGNIQMASGLGINFGAVPTSGPSPTSSTLDDYEEGTFTPSLEFGGAATGMTFSNRSGYYTKVGNLVSAQVLIVLTAKGTSTGNATITGLPFTTAGTNGARECSAVYSFSMSGLNSLPMAVTDLNGTFATLYESGASGRGNLTDANFTNGSGIVLRLTYEA